MTRLIAAKMPEDRGPDSLEAHLRRLLDDFGLWGYHTRNSVGSARGWPDWVILGGSVILYRELKSEAGVLHPDQRRVGAMIMKAGGNWAVWRPRDLLNGVIQRQLQDISGKQGELWTI